MKKRLPVTHRLGERIRTVRRGQGMSQEALAAACNLDRTYISGIERGQRNPGLRNIEVIASALGMSLKQLFEGV